MRRASATPSAPSAPHSKRRTTPARRRLTRRSTSARSSRVTSRAPAASAPSLRTARTRSCCAASWAATSPNAPPSTPLSRGCERTPVHATLSRVWTRLPAKFSPRSSTLCCVSCATPSCWGTEAGPRRLDDGSQRGSQGSGPPDESRELMAPWPRGGGRAGRGGGAPLLRDP